jgi:hypothetical protein
MAVKVLLSALSSYGARKAFPTESLQAPGPLSLFTMASLVAPVGAVGVLGG